MDDLESFVAPWIALANAGFSILPLLAFSIFVAFVSSAFAKNSIQAEPTAIDENQNIGTQHQDAKNNEIEKAQKYSPDDHQKFSFVYFLMLAIFGVVLSILTDMVGGFDSLSSKSGATDNNFVGAILSTIVAAIGVLGALIVGDKFVSLKRALGAIVLLITFSVGGMYWVEFSFVT